MKRNLLTIPALLMLSLLAACTKLGKEKIYNGVELYHTADVSDTLADALGKYLQARGFADGSEKTVQLTKIDHQYHFRFVVKGEKYKDSASVRSAKTFATQLSAEIFDGLPVAVDMCDDLMEIKKTVGSGYFGKVAFFNGVELFYTDENVSRQEVDSLGKYLLVNKFANGTPKTVQLTKPIGAYQFRFVVKKGTEKDPQTVAAVKKFGGELSANVFHGAPVEVHMCGENLETLLVIPVENK